jgi:hypothetical protein
LPQTSIYITLLHPEITRNRALLYQLTPLATMSFEVSQAYDDDFARFVPSLFGIMGTGGFVATLWPNNQTEEGQKQAIERFMIEK